jgi:sugar transferase (PEP-CTERM/EpsH1 system associated)
MRQQDRREGESAAKRDGAEGGRLGAAAPLIVHVVHRFAVGGLENGLVNLLNGLPRDAWRHAVIALADVDSGFASRVARGDVEMIALGKGPGHAVPLYPKLVRLFRSLRPSIVHTRNLAALEATPAAWFAGVASRVHGEHGRDAEDPDGTNVRRQRIRRLYRPFVTRYVALAPDLARYLRDAIGVPDERIEQIWNGVDTARFAPAAARERIAGCPFGAPHEWLVGTVGRLDPVKDHANLARAFVHALRRAPALRDTLRLVVVGEGAERARVLSILRDAGVLDLAWLPGERADVPTVLRGLDVFVLPSFGEGVSNTILEAMACGLPVVATRVGANAELVDDGVTGRVVAAADPAALGDAIAEYAQRPEQAMGHGRAGRRRVEAQFGLERMIDRYHRLYLAQLARARGAVAPSALAG